MAGGTYNSKKDKVLTGTRADTVSPEPNEEEVQEERGDSYRLRNRGKRVIKQKIAQYLNSNPKLKGLNINDLKYTPNEGGVYQLDRVDIGFLVVTSLIFDTAAAVLGLIDYILPPVGTFLERVTVFPVATLTLWFMFKKRGVNFLDRAASKKITAFFGTKVIGFIPMISIIPEYVLGTVITIMVLKGEDLVGLKDALDQNPEIAKMLVKYLK